MFTKQALVYMYFCLRVILVWIQCLFVESLRHAYGYVRLLVLLIGGRVEKAVLHCGK